MSRFMLSLSVIFSILSVSLVPGLSVAQVADSGLIPVASDKIRGDVSAVTSAVLLRLKGADERAIADKLKVKGSGAIHPDDGFKFENFLILSTQIVSLDQTNSDKGAHISYAGRFLLGDQFGRMTMVGFLVEYNLSKDGLKISKANWTPVFSKSPRIQMWVVPKAAVSDGLPEAAKTYQGLLGLASAYKIDMQDSSKTPKGVQDYIIMVFSKDRIDPEAKFEVLTSKTRAGKEGAKDGTRYNVYDDGWPVALVAGTFDMSKENEFFVKAIHKLGDKVNRGNDAEKVIGLWSSLPQ